MKVREIEHKYRKIDAPFNDIQYSRFKKFIKSHGLKTGVWVCNVIISAMDTEEALRSSVTQLDGHIPSEGQK